MLWRGVIAGRASGRWAGTRTEPASHDLRAVRRGLGLDRGLIELLLEFLQELVRGVFDG